MGSALQQPKYVIRNAVLTPQEREADERCEAWKQVEREKARIALFTKTYKQNRFANFEAYKGHR